MPWMNQWAAGMVLTAGAMAALGAEDAPLVVGPGPEKAPFTISKETTAITTPLRADGTVDYVAALNQMYGAGVKPEENGWVMWITQVSGRNEIAEKTAAVTLRMAGLTSLDNPPLFKDFLAYLEQTEGIGEAAANVMDDRLAHVAEIWKAADFPELAAYLDASKGQLDAAVAAANKPRWWVPMVAADGRSVMTVLLPSLAKPKWVGHALCARGLQRLGAGDFDGFLSDVGAVKMIAPKMENEFLIGTLVGVSMDQQANMAIAAAAASGRLSAAQAATLQNLLTQLPPIHNVVHASDTAERWEILDMVAAFAVRKFNGEAPSDDRNVVRALGEIDPTAVDWDMVFKSVNALVDDEVAMLRLDGLDTRKAAGEAFDKRVAALWPEADRGKGLLHRSGETREAYSQRVSGALLETFTPSLVRSRDTEDRGVMVQEMTAALVRAAEVRAKTGVWPAALADLPTDVNQKGELPAYAVGKEGPTITWAGAGRAITVGAVVPPPH